MSTSSSLLADLVVVLHFAFILFVVAGGLFALRWRWVALIHLPAVLWGVFIEVSGGVCPLTPLENALRGAGGTYTGDFIEQYLIPIIYPPGLSHGLQLLLAVLLVLINGVVYAFVWHRSKRAQTRLPSAPIR